MRSWPTCGARCWTVSQNIHGTTTSAGPLTHKVSRSSLRSPRVTKSPRWLSYEHKVRESAFAVESMKGKSLATALADIRDDQYHKLYHWVQGLSVRESAFQWRSVIKFKQSPEFPSEPTSVTRVQIVVQNSRQVYRSTAKAHRTVSPFSSSSFWRSSREHPPRRQRL